MVVALLLEQCKACTSGYFTIDGTQQMQCPVGHYCEDCEKSTCDPGTAQVRKGGKLHAVSAPVSECAC